MSGVDIVIVCLKDTATTESDTRAEQEQLPSDKEGAGRAVGIRVGGCTCNNVAGQAGLKNGDVIQAVNGKPVKSVAGAVWLYLRMKGKEDITLTVVRRGQEMSLNYKLV